MELISRDEAIKTARLMIDLTADERENEIRALPTIEKRKEGHWIKHDYAEEDGGYCIPNYECSVCHSWKREKTDYCPNCGARMKGE